MDVIDSDVKKRKGTVTKFVDKNGRLRTDASRENFQDRRRNSVLNQAINKNIIDRDNMESNNEPGKETGEVDARVESTSRVRVFVTARKDYEISNMDDVENIKSPSEDKLEKTFSDFLAKASDKKAPNDKRKAES